MTFRKGSYTLQTFRLLVRWARPHFKYLFQRFFLRSSSPLSRCTRGPWPTNCLRNTGLDVVLLRFAPPKQHGVAAICLQVAPLFADVLHIVGTPQPPAGYRYQEVPPSAAGSRGFVPSDHPWTEKGAMDQDNDEIVLEKSNILMLGPTGSGRMFIYVLRYSLLTQHQRVIQSLRNGIRLLLHCQKVK